MHTQQYLSAAVMVIAFAAPAWAQAPEIVVTANGYDIANGDSTPIYPDGTDFGTDTLPHTFTILNTGTGALSLGTVSVGGANASDFSVPTQPATSVAEGGSTSFEVTFAPTYGGPRSATLTFANNDSDEAPFTFSIQGYGLSTLTISDVVVEEGDAGASNAVFTVTLSPPSSEQATVVAHTSNIYELSATAGSDYITTQLTLTFAPTVATQMFSVPILGDTRVESDERLQVNLGDPTYAAIADYVAIGTIINDDGPPPSRVFVSGSGNDTNTCSVQSTPCRTLAGGIDQVEIDGEVIVLSTGEYNTGQITIGKGLKITSPTGIIASVRGSILINAPNSGVILRGLTMTGNSPAAALVLNAADSLSLEEMSIDGWEQGLLMFNSEPARVAVSQSLFLKSGIWDAGFANSHVSVTDTWFIGNADGAIQVRGSSVSLTRVSFIDNGIGLDIRTGSADVRACEFWANGTALATHAGSTRISRSHVFGNGTGLRNYTGTLASVGNNVVRRNGTDTVGTITSVPEQ